MENKYKFMKKEYSKEELLEAVNKKIDFEIKTLKHAKEEFIKFQENYKADTNIDERILDMATETYQKRIEDENSYSQKEMQKLKAKIDENDINFVLRDIQLDCEKQDTLFGYFTEQFYEVKNFKIDKKIVDIVVKHDLIIIDNCLERFAVQKQFINDFASASEDENVM